MSKAGRKGDGRQSGREGKKEEERKMVGGRRRKGKDMSTVYRFPHLILITNMGNRHK